MNAERPRDRLGRPLPRDAAPGLVVAGIGSTAGMGDDEVWALAVDYLDRGFPFHAHEVFESRWREAPADERAAWQALAQWGAAVTHAERGNTEGARRLAQRALEGLTTATRVPACVDVDRVLESCRRLA